MGNKEDIASGIDKNTNVQIESMKRMVQDNKGAVSKSLLTKKNKRGGGDLFSVRSSQSLGRLLNIFALGLFFFVF